MHVPESNLCTGWWWPISKLYDFKHQIWQFTFRWNTFPYSPTQYEMLLKRWTSSDWSSLLFILLSNNIIPIIVILNFSPATVGGYPFSGLSAIATRQSKSYYGTDSCKPNKQSISCDSPNHGPATTSSDKCKRGNSHWEIISHRLGRIRTGVENTQSRKANDGRRSYQSVFAGTWELYQRIR